MATSAAAPTPLRQISFDDGLLKKLWPVLTPEGKQLLESNGIAGSEQEYFLDLLNAAANGREQNREYQKEYQRQRMRMLESWEKDMFVMGQMRDGLGQTVQSFYHAFEETKRMYIVLFGVGLVLIIFALIFGFMGKNLLSVVLGGFGTANTLTFFFTKPPERVESSRAGLAQLQCALLSWFTDFNNRKSFIAQWYSQQLNVGRASDPKDLGMYDSISDPLMEHTERVLSMLQKYCKLIEAPAAAKQGKLRETLTKGHSKQSDHGIKPGAAGNKKGSKDNAETSDAPAA